MLRNVIIKKKWKYVVIFWCYMGHLNYINVHLIMLLSTTAVIKIVAHCYSLQRHFFLRAACNNALVRKQGIQRHN